METFHWAFCPQHNTVVKANEVFCKHQNSQPSTHSENFQQPILKHSHLHTGVGCQRARPMVFENHTTEEALVC